MGKLDSYFMRLALDKAWQYQGLTYPNPSVGAVIADENYNFISSGVHKQTGSIHAEVDAIKKAYLKITDDLKILEIQDATQIYNYLYKNHSNTFKNKNIFITLEPCNHFGKTPPCSKLIEELGFKRVIIGTSEVNQKAGAGAELLKDSGIHVDVGIEEQRCRELLAPFVSWQKERFVFFKLAMSSNGVIDGGAITTKESHQYVHRLRDRCDLLVIGGNSVRVDRPILDARYCKGEAPDILIYSKSIDFDRSIPLFQVKNRKVFIESNLKKIDKYKFIMVEGGEGMLKVTKGLIDHYLVFHSPNFKTGKHPNIEISLKELSSFSISKDRASWFKPI